MTDETSVATNDESTAEVATTTDASPRPPPLRLRLPVVLRGIQLAAERVAERTVMRSIVRCVAIALPIGIAFFVGLIALAVGEDLEWYTIVGIGTLLGLVAAVLFGMLGGVALAAARVRGSRQGRGRPRLAPLVRLSSGHLRRPADGRPRVERRTGHENDGVTLPSTPSTPSKRGRCGIRRSSAVPPGRRRVVPAPLPRRSHRAAGARAGPRSPPGADTLIAAPTGSGKTLAGFLRASTASTAPTTAGADVDGHPRSSTCRR